MTQIMSSSPMPSDPADPKPRRLRLPSPTRRRRFVFYAVGGAFLLALNIWAANQAVEVNRMHVPYSPFFLQQVRGGNVEAITSKGTAIQGRLKRAMQAPSATGPSQ